MMSCFTYVKKNDGMNRPSSSIVDHEYSIKYPSTMDYSGSGVSYGSSNQLVLVTFGHISTTIIGFIFPFLTNLSLAVIYSIVVNQSRATRGNSTEIASAFVSHGVHDIMGVQKSSTNDVKPQKCRTTCIHGLRYEFGECDYIPSAIDKKIEILIGWLLDPMEQGDCLSDMKALIKNGFSIYCEVEKILMQIHDDEALVLYDKLFSYACPKYIALFAPTYEKPFANCKLDSYKLQLKLFPYELKQKQLLYVVQKFLKVYLTNSLGKLATYMEVDEFALRAILMTYKHKIHVDSDGNVVSTMKLGTSSLLDYWFWTGNLSASSGCEVIINNSGQIIIRTSFSKHMPLSWLQQYVGSNCLMGYDYEQIAAYNFLGFSFDPGGITLLTIVEECRDYLQFHLEDKVVVNRWGNATELIETKLMVVVMEKNNLLGAIVTLCGSAENELNISNYMNSACNLTDAISRSFCAQSLTNVQSATAENTKKQRIIIGGGALAASKETIMPKVVHPKKVMIKLKPKVIMVISPNNEEVKKVEDESLIFDYMDSQPETNERGRAILVDWLIEFHNKFEFVSKTLYLTINIVDHYLATKTEPKKGLKLMVISTILMTSRYEEIWTLEVNDFVCILDNAYTFQQVLIVEKRMLSKLEWNVIVPTPYVLLVHCVKASTINTKTNGVH